MVQKCQLLANKPIGWQITISCLGEAPPTLPNLAFRWRMSRSLELSISHFHKFLLGQSRRLNSLNSITQDTFNFLANRLSHITLPTHYKWKINFHNATGCCKLPSTNPHYMKTPAHSSTTRCNSASKLPTLVHLVFSFCWYCVRGVNSTWGSG